MNKKLKQVAKKHRKKLAKKKAKIKQARLKASNV